MPTGLHFAKADAWFLKIYNRWGEPDPAGDQVATKKGDNVVIDCQDHPLMQLGVLINEKMHVPVRCLDPSCVEDLYQRYVGDAVPPPVYGSLRIRRGCDPEDRSRAA